MLSVQTQESIAKRKAHNSGISLKADQRINTVAKYVAVAASAYMAAQGAQALINYWFGA